MIRKQIYLEESLNRSLNEIARKRGVSQAEVIREGLHCYLAQIEHNQQGWDELFNQMRNTHIGIASLEREAIYEDRLHVAERREPYWKADES